MEAKTPKNDDWQRIDDFLSDNLRPQNEWKLSEEFPLAFSEKNRSNIRFIQDDEGIKAHAVLQPSIIQTHYHLFKVGLIGSVVTQESSQGQGYSSKIIASCLEASREQNCDFAILWTDLFNFYAKFGFEVAGSEIALQADDKFKPEFSGNVKIMKTSKVSSQALLKLYNQHSMKTVRQASDIEKFLKIPQTELYTAWNRATNQLEAYCVVGKGADFPNYIHEWGGKVSSILQVVRFIQEEKQAVITLITPPQCSNLIKQMQDHSAQKFFGILGMVNIVNPVSFCKKIKKGARSLGYDSFIFEYREGKYYFGYGEEMYETDSGQDIARLVFGPMKPEQIHSFSEQALEALNEIFPIPFWVWGWDSI